jgi:mono/diheme cytochrome c family protein
MVVAAAGLVAFGVGSAVWAQSDWKAPPEAKNVKNPRADKKNDKAAMANAKKLVETNCQSCHGSGKGDGPAAAALPPPKPADWTSARVASETDGEIFWKISNGRGAMPPWKHLPENDRWDLVDYIRTLQKK